MHPMVTPLPAFFVLFYDRTCCPNFLASRVISNFPAGFPASFVLTFSLHLPDEQCIYILLTVRGNKAYPNITFNLPLKGWDVRSSSNRVVCDVICIL